MLISRETDYALCILQSLLDVQCKATGDLSKSEMIPQQFAYKIIKKLSRAGLIEITRGVDGGCRLIGNLDTVSLYDLMVAMDDRCEVNACMDTSYQCPRRDKSGACIIHCQLASVQKKLDDELRALNLKTLLTG